MDSYLWMVKPLLACLILTGIHSYLGVHILARGVIFVDLALAQIAALGAVVALLAGLEPGAWQTYVVSLVFAVAGAAFFALSRGREDRVPQEAIIGITYAVATAAVILVLDLAKDPHGAEHLQTALTGNIVWVSWAELRKVAVIYSLIGLFHWRFRANFLAISMDPERAATQGLNVVLWDFLFYLSFAVVITSSVAMAGVLLVFSFLIVPAVFAVLLANGLAARLAIGWTVGTVVSVAGIGMSYDRPSGPVVVCLFALALLGAGAWRVVSRAPRRLVATAKLAAASALFMGVLAGVPWLLARGGGHSHEERGTFYFSPHHEPEPEGTTAEKSRMSPFMREEAARALGREGGDAARAALREIAGEERDEIVLLAVGEALHNLGDPEGARLLRHLAAHAATPFVRTSAEEALKQGRE